MTRPLFGALIGYGFISEHGHTPEYRKRAELGQLRVAAVADVSPARRAAAAAAFPQARIYDDHLALLAAESERIDFVDIATPPYAHAEVAHAALDRGLHVLCEKPLTITGLEAKALAAHAERARRVLLPCHNYRYAPVVEKVRGLLRAGVIGQVRLATLQTFRTTHARGVGEWKPDWRRDRDIAGGGIGMDHGSHSFYLAFEWLRSYPTSVTAKFHVTGAFDTEDDFSCTLAFPTGIATTHLTWTAGVRKVLYTLHGEAGAITVDDDTVTLHPLPGASPRAPLVQTIRSDWMDASHKDWFGRVVDEFLLAIDEKTFVPSSTIDAIQCVQTIAAAYESASQQSREVLVPTPPRRGHDSGAFRRAPLDPSLAPRS